MKIVNRLLQTTAIALTAVAAHAGAADAAFFDVGKLPAPSTTGKQLVDDIDSFSNTFRGRVTGTPIEINAGTFLKDEAAALGYVAEVTEPAPGRRAVIATRKGLTKPDEHLVFIAHYDILPQSLTAHYDNGSGTVMLRELARAFAAIPMNRTVTIAWYNGEEEGALASAVHAQAFKAAGTKVRSVFGFDMVGISFPVAAPEPGTTCLCMWWGDEDSAFEGVLRHVNYDVLKFPEGEGLVEVVGANDRNSDEASWDEQGFPTLRWAGMRRASSYPGYHMPDDNLATMESVAGSRANLEAGMRNTLESAYRTALALDNEMPVAKATASGERTVTFDGSGSSDPDGPVGSYTWDFGDGSTGSGPTATHSFARAGTYDVKLTVTDNIHPQVTSTAVIPVIAGGAPSTGTTGPPAKASCAAKAKRIKSAKRRKAAQRKCVRAACTKKAKRIKNATKRRAALRRCAKK